MRCGFYIFSVLFACLLVSTPVWAWSPFAFDQANELYEGEQYKDAGQIYNNLIEKKPDRPKVQFNLGDTYYRQGKFEEAEKNFLSALNSENTQIREHALYNLGNTKFRENALEESISYYDKTLEMNPDNEKAKLNREYVLRLMQQQKQQQKKQQQEQQQDESQKEKQEKEEEEEPQGKEGKEEDKDKEGEEEQKEKEKEGEDQEQKESQEDQEKGDQQKEEDQEKEKDKQADQDQQEKEDKKEDESRPEEGYTADSKKLSEKEAEFWLESIEDNPKKAAQDIIKRELLKGRYKIEQDW